MNALTHDEIVSSVGSLDDQIIAEVLATGATAEELAAAQAWRLNDEAPMNAGHSLPSGRVGRLVELLDAAEEALPGEPLE